MWPALRRPFHQCSSAGSQFAVSRVVSSALTAFPPLCSVRPPLADWGVAKLRLCHPGNGRTLLGARWPPLLELALHRSSNPATRPSRSDTTNREHCLPGPREFAASTPAPGNARPARRGAIPELCAARKAQLESCPGDHALLLLRLCVEQNKARRPSTPKPRASWRRVTCFGNSLRCFYLHRAVSSQEIDV